MPSSYLLRVKGKGLWYTVTASGAQEEEVGKGGYHAGPNKGNAKGGNKQGSRKGDNIGRSKGSSKKGGKNRGAGAQEGDFCEGGPGLDGWQGEGGSADGGEKSSSKGDGNERGL